MGPNHRLATYGSLAPGRRNHSQLDGLTGRWFEGQVYGELRNAGWGASLGYPALVLDPQGSAVDVAVFERSTCRPTGRGSTGSRGPDTSGS